MVTVLVGWLVESRVGVVEFGFLKIKFREEERERKEVLGSNVC
jgi:hypothetical protein